jgi:hypothetical protein
MKIAEASGNNIEDSDEENSEGMKTAGTSNNVVEESEEKGR